MASLARSFPWPQLRAEAACGLFAAVLHRWNTALARIADRGSPMKSRIRVSRSVVLSMTMLAVAGLATLAQRNSADAWQDFTRDLEQLRRELVIPGMSVAVVIDQRVVYARGFGLADMDIGIAATEATSYHIASITKPFSAVLVMRLSRRGSSR